MKSAWKYSNTTTVAYMVLLALTLFLSSLPVEALFRLVAVVLAFLTALGYTFYCLCCAQKSAAAGSQGLFTASGIISGISTLSWASWLWLSIEEVISPGSTLSAINIAGLPAMVCPIGLVLIGLVAVFIQRRADTSHDDRDRSTRMSRWELLLLPVGFVVEMALDYLFHFINVAALEHDESGQEFNPAVEGLGSIAYLASFVLTLALVIVALAMAIRVKDTGARSLYALAALLALPMRFYFPSLILVSAALTAVAAWLYWRQPED